MICVLHVYAAGPTSPEAWLLLRRNCLGQKYAMNTATLVLGHILQRFTVELPSEADRQLHFREENLSLETTDGIHLRMIPRQQQM